MAVRVKWSYASSLVLTSIALLTVLYILTGIDAFWDLSGIVFWVSLPLLWPRPVRFEENALILERGWPKVFLRRKLPLGEIREVINVSSAERLRLIRYMKGAYLWLFLWLTVGILGLLMNAPPGPYLWGNWIFWGLVAFIREALPVGDRLFTSLCIFATALLLAGFFYHLNLDYALYFGGIGVLMALMYADDDSRPSGVLLVTDDGVYLVSPFGDEKEVLNKLSSVLLGEGQNRKDKLKESDWGAANAQTP